MILALSLESFDQTETLATEEDTFYQDGYDQGLADARKLHAAEQVKLSAGLVQSISDMEFKYIEARAETTASLAPLFAAVVQQILPLCIGHGFLQQIVALLSETTAHSLASPLKITVHGSQKEAVTLAMEASVSEAIVAVDEQLSQHAAWITHEHGELHIDMDDVAAQIEMILSAIGHSEERNKLNG